MSSPSPHPSVFGTLNKNLFGKSDAFTTIMGMQFMTAFIAFVFDPLMLWLMPDEKWAKFDIILPDMNPENDNSTTIKLAALIRKILMLILVIVAFHYVI